MLDSLQSRLDAHKLTHGTLCSVMAAALEHFSDRLMAGARADLLALEKIPFIKSRTAYARTDTPLES